MTAPPPATFVGYVSQAGGALVQNWYDSLPEVEVDEIVDTVNHLRSLPVTEWRRPEFDKVTSPLVEIRCKANKTKHVIRIYGVFDEQVRAKLILLSANECKKTDSDKPTQDLALERLALLRSGKASTHEFYFEKRTTRTDQTKQGIARPTSVFESGQGNRVPNSRDER
jgi:hypothetical protein